MVVSNVKNKIHGALPEKVLQIGEGNFLRAFADWMIDHANTTGIFGGSVVLCQPIKSGIADMINSQNGVYTLLMRGIKNGEILKKAEVVTSVSRCINPYKDFDALIEIAKSPDLKVIISNTTEAGIAYNEKDSPLDMPPSSFPAKMTVILYERYKKFKNNKGKGLLILPVELIDRNGDNLKKCVMRYAKQWGLGKDFKNWLTEENYFANTLVDRIVTGYPREEIEAISEELGYQDNILVTSELFHLWVIEAPKKWSSVLPLDKAGLNVIWTDDVNPYRTRKVRILNGTHTISVLAAYLAGYDIVTEMMNDEIFVKYLRTYIWKEVIPTIPLPEKDMNDFANGVIERFSNPFIRHRLLDISLNSVSKFKSRCLPPLFDYIEKYNKLPSVLLFGFAALIAFYKGVWIDGKYIGSCADRSYEIRDDIDILRFFENEWKKPDTVVKNTLMNEDLWGRDLTEIDGLWTTVDKYLHSIVNEGVYKAIIAMLGGI